MSVSLIIPTHNRSEALRKTLPSILSQAGLQEIIFVNDGADSETMNLINELKSQNNKIRLIPLKTKIGLPGARNIGIKAALGKYIFFCDDDVILEPDHIIKLVACAENNKADIVSGRIIYLNNGETQAEALTRADQEILPFLDEKLLTLRAWKKLEQATEVLFTHACILLRKEVLGNCSFDESILGNSYREDSDFQIRARKQGFRIFYCSQTCLFHLPREQLRGGCGFAEIHPLLFVYYRMKNNYIFLKNNYAYIKKYLGFRYSLVQLVLFSMVENLKFLASKLIKSLPRTNLDDAKA